MNAGHFNLTRKNFTQEVNKNKLILVGFSSYRCHKCIMSETAYDSVAESMHELDIPFARADAPSLKGIVAESGLESLPSIVLYKKKRPIHFTLTLMCV